MWLLLLLALVSLIKTKEKFSSKPFCVFVVWTLCFLPRAVCNRLHKFDDLLIYSLFWVNIYFPLYMHSLLWSLLTLDMTFVNCNDYFYPAMIVKSLKRMFWLKVLQCWVYLLQEASNLADHDPNPTAEPWRSAIEESVTAYVRDHYPHGVCTVCTNISIVSC